MDLRALATQAAEEAVTTHTVGIIGETKDGPCSGIGTGSVIEWQGRRMILTAAHVVGSTCFSQLRFLFRPGGTIQRQDVERRTAGVRFFKAEKIVIEGVRGFAPLDLALIEVSSNLNEKYPVTFFPLDAAATTPIPGTPVVIIGFPSALGQNVYSGHLAASRAIAYERMENSTVLSGIDASTEFVVTYTFGKDVGPGGIHPGGFSGAGIWYYQESSSPIWQASHLLGGMLTTYYPRKRLATGLRVETIMRALAQVVGV